MEAIKSSKNGNTQKGIAEMLGISRATVSLALSDSPRIKKETKERIKRLANELNYSPSDIVRSLVTGKTFTVGIFAVSFYQHFSSELTQEISKHLHKQGYSALVLATDSYGKQEEEEVETFIRKKVDGIIAIHGMPYKSKLHLKDVGIPYVLQHKPASNNLEFEEDFVTCDKYKGMSMLMEHLTGLGYRKIAYLCNPPYEGPMESRFSAYKDYLLKHGLPFKDEWVIQGLGYYQSGYEGMKRLLALPDRPEAVVSMNDSAAMGGMRSISQSGLKIPEDMAITGFNNAQETAFLPVSLTTVDQKKDVIAERLVEVLLKKINDKEDKTVYRIMVDPELVIRESCGDKIRKGGDNKAEAGVNHLV